MWETSYYLSKFFIIFLFKEETDINLMFFFLVHLRIYSRALFDCLSSAHDPHNFALPSLVADLIRQLVTIF